jgi:hypothetical protein
MCQRYIGGALLAAAAVLVAPSTGRAQNITGTAPFTSGEDGGFQTPVNEDPIYRLPTGRPGDAGFYTTAEFVMLTQTRAIGHQAIAYRGFIDSDGSVTGTPGTFVGPRTEAINTRDFSPRTFAPGWALEVGYRFDDGTRLFWNYLQLTDSHYSLGASLVPPFQRANADLSNTFLTTPVYNFNVAFAGPEFKTANQNSFGVYGVWNAATQMDVKFTQRYQEMNVGVRIPVLQTDYSRAYGMAGGRFAWFFERFYWRSVSYDVDGNTQPQFAANYTNTLSQRMYGPFLGCGNEIFIANAFSLSCDVTGAMLLDVAKQRAKYRLGDDTVQSKWGREEFKLVPNVNAAVNLWWYPISGVQIRVGYQAMSFWNTLYMLEPVGLDYGNINPSYQTRYFRLLHGFNAGIGFFF